MIGDPFRLVVFGLALAGALTAAGAAGWMANGWRLDARQAAALAAIEARLQSDKDAAQLRERELTTQRDKAIQDAHSRDQAIRDLAAGSASASGSLRDTLATFVQRLPAATPDAVRNSSATLASILDECQGRYRALAEKADHHVNDTLTLQQAWPTNPGQAARNWSPQEQE